LRQEVIAVITLESAIAISLAILLVLAAIALAPPVYQMAQQAARLEVLAVYEAQAGTNLYQTGRLTVRSAAATGLQTSPRRIVELASIAHDYYRWSSRWLEAVTR
jgi:hypothetical protein